MKPAQVQAWACERCGKVYPHDLDGEVRAEACCACATRGCDGRPEYTGTPGLLCWRCAAREEATEAAAAAERALARLQLAVMAAGKAGVVAEPCLLAEHAPAVYQRIVAGQGAVVVADVLRGAPALPQAFMAARARQRRAG